MVIKLNIPDNQLNYFLNEQVDELSEELKRLTRRSLLFKLKRNFFDEENNLVKTSEEMKKLLQDLIITKLADMNNEPINRLIKETSIMICIEILETIDSGMFRHKILEPFM